MRATLGLALLAVALSGCEGVCGKISIFNVDANPELDRWRGSDGSLQLIEVCGTDRGAFMEEGGELGLTTFVLDSNVPEDLTTTDTSPIARIVLPAGSVVFWDANLAPGKTLTMANLSGSALHKKNESRPYDLYALTNATLTVLEGPIDHQEEKLIDTVDWHESWRVRWELEFGGGVQKWSGEDLVKRGPAPSVGTPAQVPPDPRP